MVKIFDSHAHFDADWFDEDRQAVLKAATEELRGIINPGTDMQTSALAMQYAREYDNIYAGVGFHPHDAKKMQEGDLYTLAEWAQDSKVVAIGEIGLDYYYDHSPREVQQKVFIQQLDLARQLHLPVIIHNRDAHGDMMKIVKNEGRGIRGVFHCYAGSLEMAKELLKLDWFLAFGGSSTFKNASKLREVAKYVPNDRIFLETDAPYLTPEPYRGKRNVPNNVYLVLEKLAEERNQNIDDFANITNTNVEGLFEKIKCLHKS